MKKLALLVVMALAFASCAHMGGKDCGCSGKKAACECSKGGCKSDAKDADCEDCKKGS